MFKGHTAHKNCHSAKAVNRYVRTVEKSTIDKSSSVKRFYGGFNNPTNITENKEQEQQLVPFVVKHKNFPLCLHYSAGITAFF